MNESDNKTELLRQIWRLVGERGDVITKRAELRGIVNAWCSRDDDDADDDHATLAGMRLIEDACTAGLRENTELVVEALGLLAKLDEGDDAG